MSKRTAGEHTAQARKLRHRGEGCRTLARLMDTEENAARYLRMVDAYDALAEQEEQLARDVARFKHRSQCEARRAIR
jgi:hypothetical protein